MKFIALDVNEGDSFLLEYEDSLGRNKWILVDGGTDVDVVLENNNPGISNKFIDLIICTHYDKDHIQGILNLLDKDYQFTELWLPDKMRGVGDQLSNNSIFRVIEDVFDATMAYIEFWNSLPESLDNKEKIKEENRYTKEELITALDYSISLKEQHLYWKNIFEEIYYIKMCNGCEYQKKIEILECIKERNRKQGNNEVFAELFGEMLDLTIKMCKLKTIPESRGIIRWMKYEDCYVAKKPSKDFPILAMNSSVNVSRVVYFPTLMFLLGFKKDTNSKNHESLVFMYENEGIPNIVFSGDSDYYWLWSNEKSIQVKDSSIVTAPHHGSATGKAAYDTNVIYSCSSTGPTNKDITFVRSDSPSTKGYKSRPCIEYRNMISKYCTDCVKNKRIILEYDVYNKIFLEINGNSKCSRI